MVYLLILLVLLILLSIYDYKKDVSSKVINFFGDKNIVKCSLYFIYIFPIAVSTIVVSISNIETKDVFSPIVSFYATALTITFTVYSFLKTRKAAEDERKEREEQREKERKEREDQRDKERKERENKDFELREKELEAKRDYYRPIFVIENNKHKNTNQVRLLMKDNTLYLEHIVFYKYVNDEYIREKEQQLKSNEILKGDANGDFYITAKTLLGESILFYFVYSNRKKYYFYLRGNKNPIKPSYKTSDEYTTKNINEIWGIYNSLNEFEINNENEISRILSEAFPMRINLARNNETFGFDLVYSKTDLNELFNGILVYVDTFISLSKIYDEKLYNLLIHLMEILKNISNFVRFSTNPTHLKQVVNLLEDHEIIDPNKLLYNSNKFILEFLKIIRDYLSDTTHIDTNSFYKDKANQVKEFLKIILNSLTSTSYSNYDNLKKIITVLKISFKMIEIEKNIPNKNKYLNQIQCHFLEYEGYLKENQ